MQFVKYLKTVEITLVLSLITVLNAMLPNAPSVKKASSKNMFQENVFFLPITVLKVVLYARPMNVFLVRLDTRHNHGQSA